MDILAAIGQSRKYNLHSHTEFCDGRAQMRAFAKEAVECGFSVYGFSPHSPVPIESPCNMAKSKVEQYLYEVKRLQNLYAGSPTRFLAAMEIDYLGDDWGPANPFFQNLPLDYRIGSVHFIPSQDGTLIDIDGSPERFMKNMSLHFHDDLRYVADTFFNQSKRMLRAGGFDIIGHFDKISQNGSSYDAGLESYGWYADHIEELICEIKKAGVIVEINTKAYKEHHRFFPASAHWKRLVEENIPIVVNSDAHVPALIDASRQEAFGILDSIMAATPHSATAYGNL